MSILQDSWILWFHNLQSKDWTINGYEKVGEIKTIEDFWVLYNNVDFTIGMYFIMRSKYIPIWDDPCNINSSSFTNRYTINDSHYHFTMMSALLIGENLNPLITGLSVSPKTKNAVIRIWISDNNFDNQTIKIYNNNNIDTYSININEWQFNKKFM